MAPEKEKPGKSRGEGHHSAKLTWAKVDEIRARQPWKLTIAEDIQDDTKLVTPTAKGGAGFGAQWDGSRAA